MYAALTAKSSIRRPHGEERSEGARLEPWPGIHTNEPASVASFDIF
jgi:hypothetical protein